MPSIVLYQSTLPLLHLVCSFTSSASKPPLSITSLATSAILYISLCSHLSLGWLADLLQSARPSTPRCLPTTSSQSSTLLLLQCLLHQSLFVLHHPPWSAARATCAAAPRLRSRCPSLTLLPPTASARRRRASAYMLASSLGATRYALLVPSSDFGAMTNSWTIGLHSR